MEALILTLFIGIVAVFSALVAFAAALNRGELDAEDALSLLPLEDDDAAPLLVGTGREMHVRDEAPLPHEAS